MTTDENYDECPLNDDKVHGPLVSIYDPEMNTGWATIQCERCGITTGMWIDPKELDWG
jgi:hypothetical protein